MGGSSVDNTCRKKINNYFMYFLLIIDMKWLQVMTMNE